VSVWRKLGLACVLAASLSGGPGGAQPISDPAGEANRGVVGIITGMAGGTYMQTAADLTILDSDRLRVLPTLGKGSLQNLIDILYLRGIDIGFVQSDVLTYARQRNLLHDLDRIQYITKLYTEEVHVLAREDIHTVDDLAGKRINVDIAGSGSAMTAEILLKAFGVDAHIEYRRAADGLELLKRGDISAIIHVGGGPIPLYAGIPAGSGLHFVSIPLTEELARTYLPGEMSKAMYPNLVPGDSVPTLAVADVMAVFGWPKQSARYAKVANFVDTFFARFSEFQQPPRHPKWREVSLVEDVPGWARFPEASEWLQKAMTPASDTPLTLEDFNRFLASTTGAAMTTLQREALMNRMRNWVRDRARQTN
jgi:TRAP transporter TAXI family solute receptor